MARLAVLNEVNNELAIIGPVDRLVDSNCRRGAAIDPDTSS